MRQEIEEIKSLPVAEGFSQICIPGEIEANKKKERVKKGIPLSDNVLRCLLYTSPSPRDISGSRMPSSA